MNSARILIAAVAVLASGLAVIFGYCHGTVSFSGAYPVSGTSLQLNVTTTGLPAMAGLALMAIGVVLLIWASVDAIMSQLPSGQMTRRDLRSKA